MLQKIQKFPMIQSCPLHPLQMIPSRPAGHSQRIASVTATAHSGLQDPRRTTALALAFIVASLNLSASRPAFAAAPSYAKAQAAAPAAASTARAIGTVTVIAPGSLTLKSDDGKTTTVSVPDGTRTLQIAPGSTSLKSAEAIALSDIAVGDRILVTGQPAAGETPGAATLQAARVILMKSMDIAKQHAAEAEDWEKHGTGGIVSAVDPATATITLTSRSRKVNVTTTSATLFRRYAGDSVKYEDAKPSALAQIQPGDQMRVRGQRSDSDPAASQPASTQPAATSGQPQSVIIIQAAEIVSGSFLNLAGTIATLDAATNTFTIKDLTTKKIYTVAATANSNIRYLSPEQARSFAAREHGSQPEHSGNSADGTHNRPNLPSKSPSGQASGHPAAAPHPSATSAVTAASGTATAPSGTTAAAGTAPAAGAPATPQTLTQMLPQLPTTNLSELRVGDALMIVASQPTPGSSSLTAVTILAGVEPILTATPTGQSGPSLSPWNVSGAPDGGM